MSSFHGHKHATLWGDSTEIHCSDHFTICAYTKVHLSPIYLHLEEGRGEEGLAQPLSLRWDNQAWLNHKGDVYFHKTVHNSVNAALILE